MRKNQRPLSPHLQIYKFQLTSTLSILHRFTGMILMVGGGGLSIWLFLLSQGASTFHYFEQFLKHTIFQWVLIGILFSFFYHLLNGIRHLIWDAGYGYELKTVYRTGWGVVTLTLFLTLWVWILKG